MLYESILLKVYVHILLKTDSIFQNYIHIQITINRNINLSSLESKH